VIEKMNIFNMLPKAEVFVESNTDERQGPFVAVFTKDTAMIADTTLRVHVGDTLIKRENNEETRFRICAVNVAEGFGSLPAYCQLSLDAD
jgi:hypothetical protein